MEEKKNATELKDTVYAMLSDDYKERLKAEHRQLLIRMTKLNDYLMRCDDIDKDYDKFNTMVQQILTMQLYQSFLEERALKENIDLYNWD